MNSSVFGGGSFMGGGMRNRDLGSVAGPIEVPEVSWLGDSNTQGAQGATIPYNNANPGAYGESYPLMATYRTNRLIMGRNAGVSGNTVEQMDARADADVLNNAMRGGILGYMGGTNNIAQTGEAASPIMAKIEPTIARAKNKGLRVVMLSPPPNSATTTRRDLTTDLAAAYQAKAAQWGCHFIDIHSLLRAPDGSWASSTYHTGDGTHLSRVGELLVEAEIRAKFEQFGLLTSSRLASDFLITSGNGPYLPMSGVFDGTQDVNLRPTGWNGGTASGSLGGVRTMVQDQYATGYWARVSKTGAGDFAHVRRTGLIGNFPAAGTRVMFLARVRTANMIQDDSNYYRMTVQILFTGVPNFRPLYLIRYDTGIAGNVIGSSFIMPSGATAAEITSNIVPTGSPTNTATFDIAQVSLFAHPGGLT